MRRGRSSGNESTRKRAFIISVIGGITLLALAATVFAVASQARSVSTQAERSVQATENLRVVAIARAELSIAKTQANLRPDQTDVLSSTLESATEALDAVDANFDDATPDESRNAFNAFRSAAQEQSDLIMSGGATGEAAENAEQSTGAAFDVLSNVLRAEQVGALDGLSDENDLMNVISTIATFVVAFVVPSAALYIFETLRRTPRRTRELEHAYETTTTTSLAMAAAISKEAKQLRSAIDRLPEQFHSDDLRRSVLRFEHVAALNGAVRTVHNEELDLREIAMEITRTVGHHIAVKDDAANDALVHGDRQQVLLVLAELLHNAVTHGDSPVGLEVATEERNVVVTVTDHGSGLPEEIEDAIIHDNNYATRGNLMSGSYGFGLLAAREAAELLGGRLRYHRNDGETSLIVELPRRGMAPEQPTDMSLPAALESRSAA